jgi:hypothetical protein
VPRWRLLPEALNLLVGSGFVSTFSAPSRKLRAFGCVSALFYLSLFVIFWTAMGYFILATALPVMFVLWRTYKGPGLAVVKTRSGSLLSRELQTERHGELLTS